MPYTAFPVSIPRTSAGARRPPFSQERYGIGLRKGDADGRHAINDATRKMIESGEWRAPLERTIGPSGYRIPDPPDVGD